MAIKLHDVIKLYLDQLQQVENLAQKTISHSQTTDKTLTDRRDRLRDYEVGFNGLGAIAFDNSVDHNLLRSQHLIAKLGAVKDASNHIRRMIDKVTSEADTSLDIPASTIDWSNPSLDYFGTVVMEVQHRLRDEALVGNFQGELDAILELHSDVLTTWVNQVRDTIKSEFQNKHDNNVQDINDRYTRLQKNRGAGHEDPTLRADQKQELQDQNFKLESAKFEVDRIATYVLNTMENWRTKVQAFTAQYIELVLGAANIDTVSAGEFIHQLVQSGAPIMIWKTADGGLIVGVNGFDDGLSDEENAKIVEDAINQYIKDNFLDGTTHVTILGYGDGGPVAQKVAQDVGNQPGSFPYQINNEVLVGSKLIDEPAHNTEYDAYSFTRDINISGGWGPVFAPNIPSLAKNIVTSGIQLPFKTPYSMALTYAVGVGEQMYDRQYKDKEAQLQGMDPSHTYSVDPRSVDHIQMLPDEIDAHTPSIFSDLLDDTHYENSTTLNNIIMPNPTDTSKMLPGNNVTRTPITSTADAPISAPTTYFVHKGDKKARLGTPIPGTNNVSQEW